jgi:hypothetical protein
MPARFRWRLNEVSAEEPDDAGTGVAIFAITL